MPVLWLAIGMGAFYLTSLIRSLIDTDKKPIACDVCMALWASLLVLGSLILLELPDIHSLTDIDYSVFWNVLPSAGVGYLLLKIKEALSPKPGPNLAFLHDADDKKDRIIDPYKSA